MSGVDRDMRSDALREQAIDEAARVITLVAADTLGSQPLASLPRQQCQGRFTPRPRLPDKLVRNSFESVVLAPNCVVAGEASGAPASFQHQESQTASTTGVERKLPPSAWTTWPFR